ncbi:expressed unknown protein [Seminavis robusta]|uniref:Uncharacterized protein n=1 Tax=Seminavis robusta TaxID=568900 RepID=A0A9N8H282_9STRA|nr:expressed unknown protein [Seminavis robusta]|eukprot:Sro31_g020261.1  (104) ;mRNA; f:78326-78637
MINKIALVGLCLAGSLSQSAQARGHLSDIFYGSSSSVKGRGADCNSDVPDATAAKPRQPLPSFASFSSSAGSSTPDVYDQYQEYKGALSSWAVQQLVSPESTI